MILDRNVVFINKLTIIFCASLTQLWLYSFLLCCGDIETNPGPSSGSNTSPVSLSSTSSLTSLPYDSHLSVCHLNIQSLLPKIDILQYEMQPYGDFVFTESWLNNEIGTDSLRIINFNDPFRCDRETRAGGVAIYVKESITCKRRLDLELNNLECIWVEIKTHGHTVLIAGMYRPPNANQNYWNLISKSVDRVKNTTISDIMILGDLNNAMLISSKCKNLNELILNYGFTQLINEPTHFTEHSSSLIDVIMVTNVNNTIASEVCDPFLPNLIRYHCPVAVILSLKTFKPQNYKRRIWKYEEADYIKYRQILLDVDLYETVRNSLDVDTIVEKINSTLLTAAEQSIPNKIVTIRPADQPWMHNEIRKLFRQRKRIHKQAKRTNNDLKWSKFRRIRNKIVQKIRSAKLRYETSTAARLRDKTTNVKKWWKLSKEILSIDNKTDTIPDITYNGKIYETNLEKADVLNSFLITQSQLTNDIPNLPRFIPPPYPHLEMITISAQEVKDVLRNLNVTKASGPDLISPRLLKEAATK